MEAIAILDRVVNEENPVFKETEYTMVRRYLEYQLTTSNTLRTGIVVHLN